MSRPHRRLQALRPVLPLAVLAAVALAGALAGAPAGAPAAPGAEGTAPHDDTTDAAQLVQRYDRWAAGLDGGASLAARQRTAAPAAPAVPAEPAAPAVRRAAPAAAGPTMAGCPSSSKSTPRTPSPGC